MKPFLILLAAVTVLTIGCGSTATSPAGTTAIQFTAQLLPSNETPPVTNAESTGSGTATIVFFPIRDSSGAITSTTVNFTVTLTGFLATTSVTAAHIHTGAVGVPGGILISTTVASGDVTLTNGAGSFSRVGLAVPSSVNVQSIIDNPAGFYFNVHTAANPGGVMRGQLVKS